MEKQKRRKLKLIHRASVVKEQIERIEEEKALDVYTSGSKLGKNFYSSAVRYEMKEDSRKKL